MGNARSGRRPSLERLLRDAGMDARLIQEAVATAAADHRDLGRKLVAIHGQADQVLRTVDDALAEMRRTTTVRLASHAGALSEAA